MNSLKIIKIERKLLIGLEARLEMQWDIKTQ